MERGARPMLYQNEYVWLVFVSALDIMFTWVVLHHGGYEANALAARAMENFGLPGLVLYKFAFVVLVIVICEVVGRRRAATGRKLALVAIGVTCVPVMIAVVLVGGR